MKKIVYTWRHGDAVYRAVDIGSCVSIEVLDYDALGEERWIEPSKGTIATQSSPCSEKPGTCRRRP